MDLPVILKNLLQAQENFDSISYSECFSHDALVIDEGNIYKGKDEIKSWNEKANKEYETKLEVLEIYPENKTIMLKLNVTGTFDGSPIVLKFKFQIENDKISELMISN